MKSAWPAGPAHRRPRAVRGEGLGGGPPWPCAGPSHPSCQPLLCAHWAPTPGGLGRPGPHTFPGVSTTPLPPVFQSRAPGLPSSTVHLPRAPSFSSPRPPTPALGAAWGLTCLRFSL